MISWMMVIYLAFSINNIFIFFSVYWPLIVSKYGKRCKTILMMSSVFKTVTAKITFIAFVFTLIIQQMKIKTVTPVGNDTYDITFFAGMELGKIRVVKRKNKICEILNNDDVSILKELEPFTKFTPTTWIPTDSAVFFDDGDLVVI